MLLLYTANPYILQIKEQVVRVPKQFARKSQSLEGYLSNSRKVLSTSPAYNYRRNFRGQNIYQVQEKSTILLAFFCIIKESTPID